jgi:RecA-family ATPase
MELVKASDWKESSQEWLIPGFLCDSLTLLSGEPKSGKTSLACHLISALVNGTNFLGEQPTQNNLKVAYMGFDFKWQREVRERLSGVADKVFLATSANYKEESEWAALSAQIKALGINLLVIDHLYNFSDGADLDRQNQIQPVFKPIMSLIKETGVAVLLLTQGARGQGGRSAHSVAIDGQARWLLRLSASAKLKTLNALGNNAETKTIKIALSPKQLELISKPAEKMAKPNSERELADRARFIIGTAPKEVLRTATALGTWLSQQDIGLGNPRSGRTAVNNLISGELLARDGVKGPIIAGPRLVL